MTSRILSEDPSAQGKRLNACPACDALSVEISKHNGQWKVSCKCGKQSIGNSPSQAMERWNSK